MKDKTLTLGRRLRYGAEAGVFFLLMGFFHLFSLDTASAVGGFIGRNIFYRTGMTKHARANLHAAFPEKSAAEIEAIIMAMWDNLGRTVAEYAHLDKIDTLGPGARITVTGEAEAAIHVAAGRGVMFLSGHFANWEPVPRAAVDRGWDGAIVHRPPNNPFVARYIGRRRALRGPKEQVSKHNGVRRIFALLRGGKSVFMLVDQKTDEGIAVPFFGRDVMTTPTPAALALKIGSRIVLVSNRRVGGAYFHVVLHPALEFEPGANEADDILRLTKMINEGIEAMVREDPSQWLWVHRRWAPPKPVPSRKR